MASTTIPLGLEIRRLCWKDDSFRQADHEPGLDPTTGLPAGMLGWWDDTIGNAITFSNNNATGTDTLYGGATTYGAMNIVYSNAISNGDELYLPGDVTVEKDFPVAIPSDIVNDLRLRARNAGSATTTLTVNLLDATRTVVESYPLFTLASSIYAHYTLPILYGAADYSVAQVYGIQLVCDNGAYIDYVAFGSTDYVNQGGQSMNVTIPKKTDSQTRPNATDIIQQLGISSRSVSILIPKINYTTFVWLKDKLNRAIPIELLTPTQQTTGYIVDVKRHSEAGWVGVFYS
jgi:hypothetical protein